MADSMGEFVNFDLFGPGVAGEDDALAALPYAERLKHYLGESASKLPPSSSSAADDSSHPFSIHAPELASPLDGFHLPGSPFAPSSTSGADDSSPHSFGDMDDDPLSWAIDPTFLGTDNLSLFPDVSQNALFAFAPDLPPLPSLPLPVPLPTTNTAAVDIPVAAQPSPPLIKQEEITFVPRDRSVSVIEEESDEDASSDSDDDDAGPKRSKRTTSTSSSRKSSKTSVSAFASSTLHPTSTRSTLPPVPEWNDKPDPESYKKLDSKAKRQLRNKISARNFRHRRKEHITTLEEQIQKRDECIDRLRDEVGSMKDENKSLHSEVSLLKGKWEEMLTKMTSFTAPNVGLGVAPKLSPPPFAALAATPTTTTTPDESWALDSESLAARLASPPLGAFSALLPEFHLPKLTPSLFTLPQPQSFNPALNALSEQQRSQLPQATAHLRAPRPGTFDGFFESNPYWLRPEHVEEYRSQLYGKMANNMAGTAAAHKAAASSTSTSPASSSGSPPSTQYLPILPGFRPSFFTSPVSLPTPPSSSSSSTTDDLLAFQSPSLALSQQQQNQHVARLATTTLLSRMTSAFVDAFSGGPPAGTGGGMMNPDKVASVLSGRSTVKVVPNINADDLVARMGQLGIATAEGRTERRPASPPCSFDAVVGQAWATKKA
ncbi:hypothetical protein RQP46_009069 [Phenoliferia psychrophenolica]